MTCYLLKSFALLKKNRDQTYGGMITSFPMRLQEKWY